MELRELMVIYEQWEEKSFADWFGWDSPGIVLRSLNSCA